MNELRKGCQVTAQRIFESCSFGHLKIRHVNVGEWNGFGGKRSDGSVTFSQIAFPPLLFAFLPMLMLNTKSQKEGPAVGHPHGHGDSAGSQPALRDGAGAVTLGLPSVCFSAVWIGFPTPARAPDSGFFGCPLWGILLPSKNPCGIPRHATSQPIRPHFVVGYFLVLVSHTAGFTLLYIWGDCVSIAWASSYSGLCPVWAELGGDGSVSTTRRLPL